MSPRPRDALPPDVVHRLAEAKAHHDKTTTEARDTLQAVVVDALRFGSVRQVAAAAGLSPTTVQHWSQGRGR